MGMRAQRTASLTRPGPAVFPFAVHKTHVGCTLELRPVLRLQDVWIRIRANSAEVERSDSTEILTGRCGVVTVASLTIILSKHDMYEL